VWFNPGSHRLHIRDGHGSDGNAGCDPPEELPEGEVTVVRIEMRPLSVMVYYGGELKCTQTRGDRQVFDSVVVYAADPWHVPALASINRFFLQALEPVEGCIDVTACNTDAGASTDDGSCVYAAEGEDCAGNALQLIDGATYFINNPSGPQPLTQAGEHAVVSVPADYTIGFEIVPEAEVVASWGSILHLTATGNNCCNYGDRIPAVWFYPGNLRLHIRDGSAADGNDGCDPEDQLPLNEDTTVLLQIRANVLAVYYNGELKCQGDRGERSEFTNARVFMPDPWHDAADATVDDAYLKPA